MTGGFYINIGFLFQNSTQKIKLKAAISSSLIRTFIPTADIPIYLGKSSAAVGDTHTRLPHSFLLLSHSWPKSNHDCRRLDLAKKIGNKLPSRINEFRSFLSRCFWHALQ
jgi:hypothetical protein